MSTEAAALEAATIRQQCKVLRMPAIAAQCAQLAEQAVRERRTHLGYLEALLQAELEERDQRLIERRIAVDPAALADSTIALADLLKAKP